jgi:hypothetical protein
LRSFGADDIWKVSTGKGVTVAVIDDPVDGSHPDLVRGLCGHVTCRKGIC